MRQLRRSISNKPNLNLQSPLLSQGPVSFLRLSLRHAFIATTFGDTKSRVLNSFQRLKDRCQVSLEIIAEL